jgi:hypothetical protein
MMKQNLFSPTDDRPQKPKLHISQNDFIDIITTTVATPVLSNEIEHQVVSSEDFEIEIDNQ